MFCSPEFQDAWQLQTFQTYRQVLTGWVHVLDVVMDGGVFGVSGHRFGEDSSSIKSSKNYRGYSSSCGSFIYHSKVDVEKQVFAGLFLHPIILSEFDWDIQIRS